MLESIPGLPQFVAATLTGMGHLAGQRLMALVLKRFTQSSATTTANEQFLLRKVDLAELNGSIPDGFRLCRFHETNLVETFTDRPPASVEEGDSLWLIPTGELVLSTEVPMGDTMAEADFVVEFDPGEALGRLLAKGDRMDRGAIGEVVAAGLIAALAMPGMGGWSALLHADRKKLGAFRASLDQSLRNQGIRCNQIREVRSRLKVDTETADGNSNHSQAAPSKADSGDTDVALLAETLRGLKSEADWNALQTGLVEAGIPVDATARRELAALREETLKQLLSPDRAVNPLTSLTARAFERAGVELPELSRWQALSQRLNEEGLVDAVEGSPSAASPLGVATAKLPATWWVWNRAEVDRRRLLFVRRSVEHCWTACNQALATIRDVPALRQVRALREQLALARELLATTPPLTPEQRALRIEGWKVKELLRGLEQAVAASDRLSTQTRRFLAANPGATEWHDAQHDCLHAVHGLIQNLNDRRAVR